MRDHICYLAEMEGLSDSTIELYKLAFKVLIEIYGEDYSIHHIDRSIVGDVKRHLLEKGNRPATVNSYLGKLRTAFDRLYADGKLERNPLYKFKRLREPNDRKKAFTIDEVKRLLEILETHPNRNLSHLLRISIYTGLRCSEVLLIERDDVNMSERFFHAVNIKSRDKHKNYREIPEQVIDDFRYFLETYPNKSQPFKVYQRSNSYTCLTKKLLKKHGFHPDLHLHSLRHTAITLAVDSGMPIREVQRIIDHSSITVTEMYAHDEVRKALKLGLE